MKKSEKILNGIIISLIIVLGSIMTPLCYAITNEETSNIGSEQETKTVSNVWKDGIYEIQIASNTSKCLEVFDASNSNYANIQLGTYAGANQQKFKIINQGNGYYTIEALHSGKVLDVEGSSHANGANVQQYAKNQTVAQKWIIKETDDGYCNIISVCNNLYLDVAYGSTENGANVQVYEGNGTKAQKFILKELESLVGTQTIEDGYYIINSGVASNKVLEISGGSNKNGANLQIGQNNESKQQKFKITYLNNGYYTIVNYKTAKSLDIPYESRAVGTNVQQYTSNNTNAQKWIIKDAGNGYFYIMSICNGLYLDVAYGSSANGTKVQVYTGNGTSAQKFKFTKIDTIIGEKTISDGYYTIATSLKPNKVLDIEGRSINNGANLQLWEYANGKNQKYKITYIGNGYYTMRNVTSKKYLDIAYAGTTNGTNVWQYEENESDAQKWIIKKTEDGYYNIISFCNDLYLDVAYGSTANGTNIQVYEGNGTKAQKFIFTPVEVIEGTQSISNGTYKISMYIDNNKVLDVVEGSNYNGANIQIWSYANCLQQKFKIEYIGNGYYTIKSARSGKVLDVAGGAGVNGSNVQQYESNGTDAQKWIIYPVGDGSYNIISACNDLYLDVAYGSTNNGTNVQIYTANKTSAQKFKFEEVTAIEPETGTYGSSGLYIKGDSRGSELKYYKIGNGPNVFFATFAVHGFEDAWNYDGQELTKIAEEFKEKLISMQDEGLANKWTIYIFPSVNPDGEYHGYTNNGPGRTSLYSDAPDNKGIDINRCWSAGYKSETKKERNYNGTEPFQAYEARALREFLINHRATNGQTILVDLHGWLNETIGDDGIGSYYRSQFGMTQHIPTYGQGYLVNWAVNNLGFNGRTARACLVEMPEVSNPSQVSSWGYANKYINATINMLRGII